MTEHADHEYLLLTLQWVERKLKENPGHPTLAGQRSALIGAISRAEPPAANEPGPAFQKAGPGAVALRKAWSVVYDAECAIGEHFWDGELAEAAEAAEGALHHLRDVVSTKLRELVGREMPADHVVEPPRGDGSGPPYRRPALTREDLLAEIAKAESAACVNMQVPIPDLKRLLQQKT